MLTEGYDRRAGEYDGIAGEQYLFGLRRLLSLISSPKEPAILDVGCATGTSLLEAGRVFGPCRRLVGVDLSPGMVAAAREKAALLHVPAEFLVADAEHLPLADAAFDLILCNSAFHWFTDRRQVVGEFSRVLRPGGRLLLTTMAAPAFQEWNDQVADVWARLMGTETRPWFPALPEERELAGYLQEAGLQREFWNYPVHPVLIQEKDLPRFVRLMAAVAPNWLPDDAGRAEQMVNETIVAIGQRYPDGFLCTSASLEVVARRA